MRAYWEALGHFVHEFAHVEKMLFSILQRTAQVSMPVARAIFHGARSDGARQFINRMLEVTEPNPAIAEDFKFIFAQLAHITDARNSLLHYGTEFNEGTDFLSTNRFIALTKERVKNIPMSVEILNQMSQLQNCLARPAYRTRGDREYRILQACVGWRRRRYGELAIV
jgi:hypothetical protein